MKGIGGDIPRPSGFPPAERQETEQDLMPPRLAKWLGRIGLTLVVLGVVILVFVAVQVIFDVDPFGWDPSR